MAERAAIEGAANGWQGAPPAYAVRGRVYCVRCAADVSGLPHLARYCNRCGAGLPEGMYRFNPPCIAGASPPTATFNVPPEPAQPPPILLAYAKAMFNLGHRYETAVGSRRNMKEAVRCYWKAARLGDPAAWERYGAHAKTVPVLPSEPPTMPNGPLPVRDPSPPFAAVHRPGVA